MRRSIWFRPAPPDALESRLVLNHTPARGLSVVVSTLYPHLQVLNHRQQPVIAEINQSFDSFQSDYGQARAAYYALIQNQMNTTQSATQAQSAFQMYTEQRVTLLAQQVISSFLQSPLGTSRTGGHPELIATLVATKLTPLRASAGQTQIPTPPGTLANSLLASIPAPGTPPATLSLYSLTQDNAIEAARVAVINGANIAKNADFGNNTQTHH